MLQGYPSEHDCGIVNVVSVSTTDDSLVIVFVMMTSKDDDNDTCHAHAHTCVLGIAGCLVSEHRCGGQCPPVPALATRHRVSTLAPATLLLLSLVQWVNDLS